MPHPRLPLRLIALFLCLSFFGCPGGVGTERRVRDIPPPPGYARPAVSTGSFAAWLEELPLKKGAAILLHTGQANAGHVFNVLAVIDKPLYFSDNTEECVDFCLRLWADFHLDRGRLDSLYLFDYDGNRLYFPDKGAAGDAAFRDFLKKGMAWASPFSVRQGARPVSADDIRPGDCVIQIKGRLRGHASMLVDECVNRKGERLFLIGFGFSPAQEFHIERAPDGFGAGGWFSLDGCLHFLERRYGYFGKPELVRL